MERFYYLITLVMLLLATPLHAEIINDYMNSFTEQESAKEWVLSKSNTKQVNDTVANTIVRQVYAYATSAGIKPSLLLAMMKVESTFNTKARSKHQALGLMQVMPKWHKDKLKGRSLYNPEVAIEVGTKVLSDCIIKHKRVMHKAIGCYNGDRTNSYYVKVRKEQIELLAFLKRNEETLVASRKPSTEYLNE